MTWRVNRSRLSCSIVLFVCQVVIERRAAEVVENGPRMRDGILKGAPFVEGLPVVTGRRLVSVGDTRSSVKVKSGLMKRWGSAKI